MIIKYSRLISSMFIIVSVAVGTPLMLALAKNSIEQRHNWIAWIFVFIAALVLLIGLRLYAAPPTVLKIYPDGIHIYYKLGGSFTKDADLLPWKLIEKMQLIRVLGRGNSFNWAIELTLTAPPPFDATKRNARQSGILGQSDPNLFYIDTLVLNHPKEKVLAALQSSLKHWQKSPERGKQG